MDLPCRVAVSDPHSNQRPLYNHTAPEPLEDQCWWEWAKRFGKSTREQIGTLPPPYRRQLGSIVREFQRLLRCSAAKTRLCALRGPASPPKHTGLLQIFQVLFRRPAWLTSSTCCCWSTRIVLITTTTSWPGVRRVCFDGSTCLRLVVSTDDSIATFSFAENLKSWLL